MLLKKISFNGVNMAVNQVNPSHHWEHLPWIEKYRPQTIKDIAGQHKAVSDIINWLKQWGKKPPKHRALLIQGPTGVGKTSAVEAIASELDFDLFELNASDIRNKDRIEQTAGAAAYQATLTDDPNRLRIILMDEADGLSGSQDRGGIQALTLIVKDSLNPIIITASDQYNPKLITLKKYCEIVKFRRLGAPSIKKRIAQILHVEKIYIDADALTYLSTHANGDLRSAINDLQVLGAGLMDPKQSITQAMTEVILSPRDREVAVFQSLDRLFKSKTVFEALRAQRQTDIDYDMFKRWISENIPRAIKADIERVDAFSALASGDIHMQRARRTGNWKLLSYGLELISAGVALSQYLPVRGYVPYQFPSWISSLSRARAKRIRTTEISKHIGMQLHVSHKIVRDQYLPILRVILSINADVGRNIIQGLRLTEEMVDHIAGKKMHKQLFKSKKAPQKKKKRAKKVSS
jgi:replication factor C large subunit